MILGIDEVGRGAWAGPLVVGAVVLGGIDIDGLTDSKLLTKKRRQQLNDEIQQRTPGIGLGWVDAAEIDSIGLAAALHVATKRAVQAVKSPFHEIIIDGTINFLADTSLADHVRTIKQADRLIPSVSAASIVAKVARDEYMTRQAAKFPQYGFTSHVGYGTQQHRDAIAQHGVTPLHRCSIAPLQKYASSSQVASSSAIKQSKSTRTIGDASETAAADALVAKGHTIIARNWKTKYCEIDIVSQKASTLYFTEVKHRQTAVSGSGLDAITPKKLRQMRFAAQMFTHMGRYETMDLRLVAIATSGLQPKVDSMLEIA